MKKVGNTSFLTKFFDSVPGKRLFGIYRCLGTVLPHSFGPATLLPNVPSHVTCHVHVSTQVPPCFLLPGGSSGVLHDQLDCWGDQLLLGLQEEAGARPPGGEETPGGAVGRFGLQLPL